MTRLRRLHFWFGLAGLLVFLLSGQYMHHVHDHLRGMPDDVRMLFRANHIYILMSALLNLLAGVYLFGLVKKHHLVLQYLASLSLLLAPLFLLAGFFTEPYMTGLVRPYSKTGIYLVFCSALIYIYLGLVNDNNNKRFGNQGDG